MRRAISCEEIKGLIDSDSRKAGSCGAPSLEPRRAAPTITRYRTRFRKEHQRDVVPEAGVDALCEFIAEFERRL